MAAPIIKPDQNTSMLSYGGVYFQVSSIRQIKAPTKEPGAWLDWIVGEGYGRQDKPFAVAFGVDENPGIKSFGLPTGVRAFALGTEIDGECLRPVVIDQAPAAP